LYDLDEGEGVFEVDVAFDTQRLSIGKVHPEKLHQIGNAPLLPSS
jgi:hypothetical protein